MHRETEYRLQTYVMYFLFLAVLYSVLGQDSASKSTINRGQISAELLILAINRSIALKGYDRTERSLSPSDVTAT